MPTQLLHKDLWTTLEKLAKTATRRRAAIAYAHEDVLHFREGDLLVTNASDAAIKCGSTSARLLKQLHQRKVDIHSCPTLHAKLLVMTGHAFVGSANLSINSRDHLTEAGLLTTDATLIDEVEAVILRLAEQSTKLTGADLDRLLKIKVHRSAPLHLEKPVGKPRAEVSPKSDLWILKLHDEEPKTKAQRDTFAEASTAGKKRKSHPEMEVDTFWYNMGGKKPNMGTRIDVGDRVIMCSSDGESEHYHTVYRQGRVIAVERDQKNAYITFESEPGWDDDQMKRGPFERLLKKSGIKPIKFLYGSRIKPEAAKTLIELWQQQAHRR